MGHIPLKISNIKEFLFNLLINPPHQFQTRYLSKMMYTLVSKVDMINIKRSTFYNLSTLIQDSRIILVKLLCEPSQVQKILRTTLE